MADPLHIYLNEREAEAIGVKEGDDIGSYGGRRVEVVIYKPVLTVEDFKLVPKTFV